MKVLFISSCNTKNGISPIVLRQGESLQAEGINLKFFAIKGKGIKGYLSNLKDLRSVIKEFKPDILHAHYSLSAYLALFAKGNSKLITSFMGDDILGSRKINGNIFFTSAILARINILISYLFFDFNIVKSKQMSTKLCSNKKTIIPNGVDLERFKNFDKNIAQAKLGFDNSKSHIIFVSNPERNEKNFELAKAATNNLESSDVMLHTVFGVSTEDLVYYYNAADVLILTSLHEGSPNVIKEAMSCNCPIVATDVGDVRWVIGDIEGCYTASFEPNDFADKLKLALKFTKEIGRTKGRERIIQLGLDAETVAKKIFEIYKKILN